MTKLKCFYLVREIMNEAAEQLGPEWVVQSEPYESLQRICDEIDEFIAEVGAEGFSAEFDEDVRGINIEVDLGKSVSEHKYKLIDEIIRNTPNMYYNHDNETGNLIVGIVRPYIWARK